MALRFSPHYDASILFWRIDAGHRGRRPGPHQLFNTTDANFRPSRPLPKSFVPRPGAGKPGANSFGMSRSAVWLAWGSPDQKIMGNMAGTPTETWIYIYYATYPYYPYYGPGLGVPGLLMIPALATAWDIPGSVWRGDAPESAWQGEYASPRRRSSCFSAVPSTTHSIGRRSRRAFPTR